MAAGKPRVAATWPLGPAAAAPSGSAAEVAAPSLSSWGLALLGRGGEEGAVGTLRP